MEQMATRGDFPHVHPVRERFHADDALWRIKLIDFLGLSILDIGYQLAVFVNQRCMQYSAHRLSVLPPILSIRILALSRPHLCHHPISIRRFSIDVASIGFDQIVEAFTIDPLISIFAAKSEHDGTASHTKAAEQDHHEQEGQLLKTAGFFSGKDLLELHLEGLEFTGLFEVASVDEKLFSVDEGVALPFDVGVGGGELAIANELLLVVANYI